MPMIDADAMDKAEKKVAEGVDFYSDLTDEERAEEDLPPRETPKPADTPSETPPPAEDTPAPDGGDDGAGDDEPTDTTDAADRLFAEIAELGAKIDAALGEKPPKTEAKRDERLDALLEHEDPDVRYLAEQMIENKKQLAELVGAERARIFSAQAKQDDADFAAVMTAYQIDGKPMSKAHREQVEDYMLENPDAGAVLTIEEATKRVFPGAVKVSPKSPPARGPGDSSKAGKQPAVATIVDQGSTGGAPQGKWEPRPNETVESAVAAFGKSRGW